jgi:AcrR family transcriptional regulator
MQLKSWLTATDTSIKAFARKVKVERAMIYRYFSGTIPRARTIRRIELITEGAVTAQDFYASAVERMNGAAASEAAQQQAAADMPAPAFGTAYNTFKPAGTSGDASTTA